MARGKGQASELVELLIPREFDFKDRFEIKPSSVTKWLETLSFVFSESAFAPGKKDGRIKCHTQYMTVLLSTSMATFDFTQKMGLKPWCLSCDFLLDVISLINQLMYEKSAICQIILCTQGNKDERGYHPWRAYMPAVNKQIAYLKRSSKFLRL